VKAEGGRQNEARSCEPVRPALNGEMTRTLQPSPELTTSCTEQRHTPGTRHGCDIMNVISGFVSPFIIRRKQNCSLTRCFQPAILYVVTRYDGWKSLTLWTRKMSVVAHRKQQKSLRLFYLERGRGIFTEVYFKAACE